jgi:hypothetical protein
VNTGGVVLDPASRPLSTAPEAQWHPTAASDGTGFLLTWEAYRVGGYDLLGTRVASDGTPTDAAGLAISTAAGDQRSPRVAFDGSSYLVVWEDDRSRPGDPDVWGARVGSDGSLPDPDAIVAACRLDKKYRNGVRFVLLEDVGRPMVVDGVTDDEVRAVLETMGASR